MGNPITKLVMKKLFFNFVLFLLSCLFFASCAELGYGITNNIDAEETYLRGTVLQTHDKGSALVSIKIGEYRTSVVKVVSEKDVFYDDKTISGKYVRIGTYSYITVEKVRKTVPVYIRKSEYKPEYKNLYQ